MNDREQDSGAGADRPVIDIEGKRLALGPVREDLPPLYQRWDNEFETIRTHIQTPAPMPLV